MGGQTDDYYECVPDKRCDTCELRFRCYTLPYFDNTGKIVGHEDMELNAHDFYVFLTMGKGKRRKCSSKAEQRAFNPYGASSILATSNEFRKCRGGIRFTSLCF